MPRRRRKNSASQRKPSLIFTESPVHQSPGYSSPVRCAHHPTTARAVPVDELNDLIWVSPQFHGPPTSGKPRRRTRLSRTNVSTRSRTLDVKDNLHTSFGGRKKLPRGFVPLKLQWDKSVEITEIEDISEVDTDCELNCSGNREFACSEYHSSPTVTPPTHVPTRERQGPANRPCDDTHSDHTAARLDLSTLTHLTDMDRLHPKVLFRGNSDSDRPSDEGQVWALRRSERLQARYQEAVQLLRSPTRSAVCERGECRVLVLDTPECEYGRTHRPARHKLASKPHLQS